MGIATRDLTPEDADALADLMLRIEADHPTGFCLGPVEIREIMTGQPESMFDGAFDDGHLVAFTAVMPGAPSDEGQKFFLFGDVDPARLGEGLGTLMLDRSIERSREHHARVAPAVPARYAGAALAGRDDQADLLRSAGLRPGRHTFLMVADLTEPPPTPALAAGITVGPVDLETSEELRLAHNAAFADYPEGAPMSESFWSTFMVTATHARHALSAIARGHDGSVAAYVFAHEYAVPPSGGAGPEIHVPYVGTLPAYRGRGIATALLSRVLHLSRGADYVTASLNVDTANPTGALGIYERAGFRQSYRQDAYHLDEP